MLCWTNLSEWTELLLCHGVSLRTMLIEIPNQNTTSSLLKVKEKGCKSNKDIRYEDT